MENQTVGASVRRRRIRKEITAWLMAVWPLVGFCLFGFIPLVLSVYLSFTKLTSFDFSAAKFIWLDNYIELFTDPDFYLAITNTLIYALSMPITLVLGMIIAVPSHPHTSAGRIYGHVGIYVGDNIVRDNIGYIRTIDVDEWISYYGVTATPRWGWANGINLEGQ